MTLIDPDEARRRREAKVPTGADLALPAAAVFLLPALMTYGLTTLINRMEAYDAMGPGEIACIVSFFISAGCLLGAIGAWVMYSMRAPALPSATFAPGAVLLGAAVGASVVAEPPRWARGPALSWPVLILLLLGIAGVGIAAAAHRAKRRRAQAELDIMAAGPPVTGVVTNQGWTTWDEECSSMMTTVTYAFVDDAGQRRYVQRRATFGREDLVLNGERVDVWFDRAEPGNAKRVVVRRRR